MNNDRGEDNEREHTTQNGTERNGKMDDIELFVKGKSDTNANTRIGRTAKHVNA